MSDATPALDGTYNYRDLGGLPLTGGGATAASVFARSDALHALTPTGVAQLAASTIGAVVDFRMAEERAIAHDRLPRDRRIHEVHRPVAQGALSHIYVDAGEERVLGDHTRVGRAATAGMTHLPTLAEIYTEMLEGGAGPFADVARLLATGTGGVLIHCTAGKDRTGVCAAVILDAVGVERAAIIEDYTLTQGNLGSAWLAHMELLVRDVGVTVTPELAEIMGGSPAAAIESVLTWLDAHGGALAFLRSGGLTADEADALRARLTARPAVRPCA